MGVIESLEMSLAFYRFPGGSDSKVSACDAGDLGSIPGSGRSPGKGNGNPLQYSRLENSMDGGVWWATVHGVTKSWTWPSEFTHSLTHSDTLKNVCCCFFLLNIVDVQYYVSFKCAIQ